jgi:hypothetical protein
MKKLKLFGLGLLGASLFLSSCADDPDEDGLAPTLTVNELGTNTSGGEITISQGEALIFAWDSRKGDVDLNTFDVDVTGVNAPTNIPQSNQGNDFPYDIANADDETYIDTLVFANAGLNTGITNYTFTVTDNDGLSREVSFDVTVGGSTPMTNEVTGAFFHIQGSLEGAYDLVNETVVAASQPNTNKDMINTDLAGEAFTGSWGAGNDTRFITANSFDYDNATVEAAESAYNDFAVPSASIGNPSAGDIIIAKLRGGNNYAVIKVVEVDPTNNECNCGNLGKITFDFKK